MEMELFSSDQSYSHFLHCFKCNCIGKSIDSYNTAIAQSHNTALGNLEITDNRSVYKWHLNKCKIRLKNRLSLQKDGDSNVLGKCKSHVIVVTLPQTPTFKCVFIHWDYCSPCPEIILAFSVSPCHSYWWDLHLDLWDFLASGLHCLHFVWSPLKWEPLHGSLGSTELDV